MVLSQTFAKHLMQQGATLEATCAAVQIPLLGAVAAAASVCNCSQKQSSYIQTSATAIQHSFAIIYSHSSCRNFAVVWMHFCCGACCGCLRSLCSHGCRLPREAIQPFTRKGCHSFVTAGYCSRLRARSQLEDAGSYTKWQY